MQTIVSIVRSLRAFDAISNWDADRRPPCRRRLETGIEAFRRSRGSQTLLLPGWHLAAALRDPRGTGTGNGTARWAHHIGQHGVEGLREALAGDGVVRHLWRGRKKEGTAEGSSVANGVGGGRGDWGTEAGSVAVSHIAIPCRAQPTSLGCKGSMAGMCRSKVTPPPPQ